MGSLLAPLGAESSLGLIVSSLGRRAQLLGRVRLPPGDLYADYVLSDHPTLSDHPPHRVHTACGWTIRPPSATGCGVRHVGGITSVFLDRRSPPPLGVKLKGSQASLTDRLPIPVRRVSDSFRPTDPDGPRRAQRGEENWGRTDRPALGRRPSTHHLHDAPSDHPHLHALGRPLSDHQPAPLPDFVFFCPAFLPKVSK